MNDALIVHANVLQFPTPCENANLALTAEKLVADTSKVDPSKLKGHGLSMRTMRSSLPVILLQIHANPCLYWLHQPAFYVLLHRLHVSTNEVSSEMDRIKRIFAYEFVTSKITDNQEIVDTLNEFNILEDVELNELLLSSILPFVFCYYNVADIILNHVRVTFSYLEHLEISLKTIYFSDLENGVQRKGTVSNRPDDG